MPPAERLRTGFLAGVLAAAAASLVMLLARLALAVPTIPELAIDPLSALTPPTLFALVLDTLTFAAKPLLTGLVVLAQLLVGGGVGAAAALALDTREPAGARAAGLRWQLALALALGLWLLAGLGLLPLLGAGPFGAAMPGGPLLAGAALLVESLVFALGLALADLWAAPAGPLGPGAPDPGRRALLRTLGWGTLAVAAGVFAVRGVSLLASNAAAARRPRRPGETLPPEVTPNPDFYTVSKNFADPTVNVATWRLSIDGLVDREVSLSYAELQALPAVEQYVTLECISNEVGGDLISNALWRGVRLRDLLALAGPQPGVRKVVLTAADGYEDSITFERAQSAANVLAYEMNGEALPPAHGYPARLLVPGIYGMKNVKWVTRVRLVDYDFKGYWQQRGWSDSAEVRTMSRLDAPQPRESYAAGPLLVGGVAFSGDRGISRVEVSPDGGQSWQEATVRQALSPYTWVLWTLDWPAPVGRQRLLVRAADRTGHLQEAEERPTLPDGATGYHEVVVQVVDG